MKEILEIAQHLSIIQALSDDTNRQIRPSISGERSCIYVPVAKFTECFFNYEVRREDYRVWLETNCFGIEITSLLLPRDLIKLQNGIPEQWEYITEKIKEEF